LGRAEIRATGTGLHAVARIDPPVEILTAADQGRWATIVRAVQASVPGDPNAPGITAFTRPVGSTNSKNGATVEVLRPGEPIEPAQVEAYVLRLIDAPFKTVAAALLGDEHVSPCPCCRTPGSRLGVSDHAGRCYTCGTVSLEKLFAVIYRTDGHDGEASNVAADPASGRSKPPTRVSRRPGGKTHKHRRDS
jgi:hypothetical protein